MSNKPQCVGIDFGTFKTSIVASNGNRDSIMTAVGLPKDHICLLYTSDAADDP